MSKAGSSLLRTTLVRAASAARKQDPQLAAIYSTQMVTGGKSHLGAICVIAAELAERAFVVIRRGTPCVIRDLDRRPVTPEEAKALIAEHFTVSSDVRARRRRTKAGKAPQRDARGTMRRSSLGTTPVAPGARVKRIA